MARIPISAKDLELIALREIRSFPGGEYIAYVGVEPPYNNWTLHAVACDGADLELIQYAVRTTANRLKRRYSLRADW